MSNTGYSKSPYEHDIDPETGLHFWPVEDCQVIYEDKTGHCHLSFTTQGVKYVTGHTCVPETMPDKAYVLPNNLLTFEPNMAYVNGLRKISELRRKYSHKVRLTIMLTVLAVVWGLAGWSSFGPQLGLPPINEYIIAFINLVSLVVMLTVGFGETVMSWLFSDWMSAFSVDLNPCYMRRTLRSPVAE